MSQVEETTYSIFTRNQQSGPKRVPDLLQAGLLGLVRLLLSALLPDPFSLAYLLV